MVCQRNEVRSWLHAPTVTNTKTLAKNYCSLSKNNARNKEKKTNANEKYANAKNSEVILLCRCFFPKSEFLRNLFEKT